MSTTSSSDSPTSSHPIPKIHPPPQHQYHHPSPISSQNSFGPAKASKRRQSHAPPSNSNSNLIRYDQSHLRHPSSPPRFINPFAAAATATTARGIPESSIGDPRLGNDIISPPLTPRLGQPYTAQYRMSMSQPPTGSYSGSTPFPLLPSSSIRSTDNNNTHNNLGPLLTKSPFSTRDISQPPPSAPQLVGLGISDGDDPNARMMRDSPSYCAPDDSKGRKGRTPTACKPCNQQKIGCDRETPCSNCIKKGIQDACAYPIHHNSWSAQKAIRGPKRKRPSKRPDPILPGPGNSQPHQFHPRQTHDHSSSLSSSTNTEGSKGLPPPFLRIPLDRNHSYSNSPVSPLTATTTMPSSYTPEAPRLIAKPAAPSGSSTSGFSLPQISLERNTTVSPVMPVHFPQPAESHERTSLRRASDPITLLRGIGRGGRTRGRSRSPEARTDGDTLMEYSQPPVIGANRPMNEGFLGSSHFGPESAEKFLAGNLSVPVFSAEPRRFSTHSQLDETKPYSLQSQVRELLAIMPSSRETCNRYVHCFFEKYNSHVDFLYKPDFDIVYTKFWNEVENHDIKIIDLRQMALILVVLAFGVLLDHNPRYISQLEKLRTASTGQGTASPEQQIAIQAAIAALSNNTVTLEEREGLSLKWCWGARRALTEASSFYGDSFDTVKATGLLALYLITCRRVTEGWKMTAQAINAAQAQGMHQDGSKWNGMSPKEAEVRRRLWAQLYILDRSVSLFLGRPVAIKEGQYVTQEPSNISDQDLLELPDRQPPPSNGIPVNLPAQKAPSLDKPTKSTFLILHFRLAKIIGQVQELCFGLHDRKLKDVIHCEKLFQNFRKSLPKHWRLDDKVDTSLDQLPGYEYLKFQRLSLISKFHLARVTLHRPYVTLFQHEMSESRRACVQSSVADLTLRTTLELSDPLDRFKWLTVASGFNSATVIGVMCICALRQKIVNDGSRYQLEKLLSLLEKYIEVESRTVRKDDKLYKELDVLQYMVNYVKFPEFRARRESRDFRGRGGSVGCLLGRKEYSGAGGRSPLARIFDLPLPTSTSLQLPPLISASHKPDLGSLINSLPSSTSILPQPQSQPPITSQNGQITLGSQLAISPTTFSLPTSAEGGGYLSSSITNSDTSNRGRSFSSSLNSAGPLVMEHNSISAVTASTFISSIYQEPSHSDPTASVLPIGAEIDKWENTIQNMYEGNFWGDSSLTGNNTYNSNGEMNGEVNTESGQGWGAPPGNVSEWTFEQLFGSWSNPVSRCNSGMGSGSGIGSSPIINNDGITTFAGGHQYTGGSGQHPLSISMTPSASLSGSGSGTGTGNTSLSEYQQSPTITSDQMMAIDGSSMGRGNSQGI